MNLQSTLLVESVTASRQLCVNTFVMMLQTDIINSDAVADEVLSWHQINETVTSQVSVFVVLLFLLCIRSLFNGPQ